MADYIRSWLKPAVPQITTQEPDNEDDNITITAEDEEDDTPPAFPALNSAQRAGGSANTQLMPPPSTLALPLSTTKAPPKPSKKRAKVALAPGHGALDWANLKNSGQDLRVREPL